MNSKGNRFQRNVVLFLAVASVFTLPGVASEEPERFLVEVRSEDGASYQGRCVIAEPECHIQVGPQGSLKFTSKAASTDPEVKSSTVEFAEYLTLAPSGIALVERSLDAINRHEVDGVAILVPQISERVQTDRLPMAESERTTIGPYEIWIPDSETDALSAWRDIHQDAD